MSTLDRIAGLFLVPASADPPDTEVLSPAPAATAAAGFVAVIAAHDHLAASAGAVAAALRRQRGARSAIVCRPGHEPARSPATHAASVLARRLAARDLLAAAAGRLCQLTLPEDPGEAATALRHALGATDAPVVLALPGRLEGYDGLLVQADRLVLAAPAATDPAITELALASLAALGPETTRITPPPTALARRAAALGVTSIALDELPVARASVVAPGGPPEWAPPTAARLESRRAGAPT